MSSNEPAGAPTPGTPDDEAPRSINPWTLWVPIIVIMLGVVVFYNYLVYNSMEAKKAQNVPPLMGRLEKDMELTERSGKKVHLEDLRGKILIASWVYTRCPRGCAGVVAKLKTLQKELGNNPNIHFLSFTLDPDDTPDIMKQFAEGIGIKETDNWWFLNGPKEEVRKYMTFSFKFRPVQDIPEADRMSPQDKYMHDLRVALVDHQGHVRGLHDIMNADATYADYWDKKIREDIQYLLKEQAKATPAAP